MLIHVLWVDEPSSLQGAEPVKDEEDMTDEERIAQLGKPKLGDILAINVHIRESIEFKVHCVHHYTLSKKGRHQTHGRNSVIS